MKRKLIVGGVLMMVCLGVLVVKGVSQTSGLRIPDPLTSPKPPVSSPTGGFSAVQPQQQSQTFEQLADALQAVRARQKELKTQEADLLAKMSERIEEKRKDLQKAEETLQQLQGAPKGPQTVIGTGGGFTTTKPRP